MPLTWGGAVSYSPVMYRPRERWKAAASMLRGSVPQPAAAGRETDEQLAQWESEIDAGFARLRDSLRRCGVEALVVLTADRGRSFDDANFPQIHVHAGDSIWSDTSLEELGEAPALRKQACDSQLADYFIEELFDSGFEIAESHGDFAPMGDRQRGAVPALVEPLARIGCELPVVPIHLNCHMAPALRGSRVQAFGAALGEAASRSRKRVGVLASGGLSGDPGGYLAGWIDPELDQWVLRQLESARSQRLVSMFDIESRALRGNSSEIRLWLAAAAAMEAAKATPEVVSYMPMHAAAAGIGFVVWEGGACQ